MCRQEGARLMTPVALKYRGRNSIPTREINRTESPGTGIRSNVMSCVTESQISTLRSDSLCRVDPAGNLVTDTELCQGTPDGRALSDYRLRLADVSSFGKKSAEWWHFNAKSPRISCYHRPISMQACQRAFALGKSISNSRVHNGDGVEGLSHGPVPSPRGPARRRDARR